jgi:hypothetical protein
MEGRKGGEEEEEEEEEEDWAATAFDEKKLGGTFIHKEPREAFRTR